MAKSDLRRRWLEVDVEVIAHEIRAADAVTESHSPFGSYLGRVDLRGLPFVAPYALEDTVFGRCDLSGANLTSVGFTHCVFQDVLFEQTSLEQLRDFGNHFECCVFRKTSFVDGMLGYEGSVYRDCLFELASFKGAGSIRPEFTGCTFRNCRLRSVDFNAASFEDCVFEGRVEDVWFHGGFQYAHERRRFGTPKENRMRNVSFANAELIDLTISDGCDLSTVILPEGDRYRRYDRWLDRLRAVQALLPQCSGTAADDVGYFLEMHLPRAEDQDWMIVDRVELQTHFPSAADWLWDALDSV